MKTCPFRDRRSHWESDSNECLSLQALVVHVGVKLPQMTPVVDKPLQRFLPARGCLLLRLQRFFVERRVNASLHQPVGAGEMPHG